MLASLGDLFRVSPVHSGLFQAHLLPAQSFIPHGHCYLWKPDLVGLHVVGDGLTAIAYYSIPFTLFHFVRKRQDLPFNWVFLLFCTFIFACGTTHLLEILTLWQPVYWLSGTVKAATAFVSLYTAGSLIYIVPEALTLANPSLLGAANRELEREIAERKQVEASLRQSEASYRAVVEDQTELICRFLTDGTFTFVNDAYCRYFGRERADLLGSTWKPGVMEEDVGQIERQLATLSPINPVTLITNRVVRADGAIRTTQWTNRAIYDATNQLIELQAVGRDITDLQQVESALQETQRLIQTVADTAPVILYIYDLVEQRTIYINHKIWDVVGYTVDEIQAMGTTLMDVLLHPDDLAQLPTWYAQWHGVQVGEILQREYRLRTRQGEWRFFQSQETLFAQTLDGHPQQILGAALDISDRKYMQQLQAALQEKDVLFKEVHHRVKNNLQIIYSLLRLQSRQVQNPQLSTILLDSQNRIKSIALIHEKLYRSDDLSKIDLKNYILTLVASLFSSYKSDTDIVNLTTEIDQITLDIDTAILCGLIINELVSNSLKYAFPENRKGEIYITVSTNESDLITLIVQDNGIGLPERLDPAQVKTLGLSLVKDLVSQLKGVITIERTQGTLFKLMFSGSKI